MADKLLQVSGLKTYFFSKEGKRVVKAVDEVSFSVGRGESFAIVGESGCGKTTTSLSIVRLLPPAANIVSGEVLFEGEDLLKKTNQEMTKIRGKCIGTIVQDPLTSLNPLFKIGEQVAEGPRLHLGLRGKALQERVLELLQKVEIPSPEMRMDEFPHQISGGMRQRIVGSIALSGHPRLIIADEPTTNLDTTTQVQFLNLLKQIQESFELSLLFITHDLGIVAKMCDHMAVMYAGRIVERGLVSTIFHEPQHPYTTALFNCRPRIGPKKTLQSIPGFPPDLANIPTGCAFNPRCPQAIDLCKEKLPFEVDLGNNHSVRCWLMN